MTLNLNEHSNGGSSMTSDMVEFYDCVNTIEVDDVCKTGLHFTWTKNLKMVKAGNMTGILKKLDRIISNDEFMKLYPRFAAKFLPYIISDHSSAILCILTGIKNHKKAFRFANFITGKKEFIGIVKDGWSKEVEGHYMFQVVKKLKGLKAPLNKLAWNKGSLFKRVENLRNQIQQVQIAIDLDPQNHQLRSIEAKLVEEFIEASVSAS